MRLRLETRVLVGAGVALVAAVATNVSGALDMPGTIKVSDQRVRYTHVDEGTRGSSAGDVDIYRVLLFNKGITPKSIGHGEMVCTSTGNFSSSCSATYFLPKGKIMVGGVIGSRLLYELAVLGGTGLYDNVRGTLTVTSLSRRNVVREFLVFRLVV